MKLTKETQLGIELDQNGTTTTITHIAPDSLFVGTNLKVGMTLDTINGTQCDSLENSIGFLKDAEGEVIITASNPDASIAAASSPTVITITEHDMISTTSNLAAITDTTIVEGEMTNVASEIESDPESEGDEVSLFIICL